MDEKKAAATAKEANEEKEDAMDVEEMTELEKRRLARMKRNEAILLKKGLVCRIVTMLQERGQPVEDLD